MAGVYNNFFQGLEWRVAYKGAADHAFEPGPFAFGAHGGVNTHKTTTGLDEAHQGEFLGIGMEDIVVGIGEDQRVILFQIFIGEVGGRIGDIYLEAIFECKLTDTGHGGGDILMHIALAVLGVDKDADVFPAKAWSCGGSRNDE